MGFLSDFIAPLADEAKVISKEINNIKKDVVDGVTSTSNVAKGIRDEATQIKDTIQSEISNATKSVTNALLPKDGTTDDNTKDE